MGVITNTTTAQLWGVTMWRTSIGALCPGVLHMVDVLEDIGGKATRELHRIYVVEGLGGDETMWQCGIGYVLVGDHNTMIGMWMHSLLY